MQTGRLTLTLGIALLSLDAGTLKIPVTCRTCGSEGLSELAVASSVTSLLGGRSISLRSACHASEWTADAVEMEQIRQYLHAAVSVNFLNS